MCSLTNTPKGTPNNDNISHVCVTQWFIQGQTQFCSSRWQQTDCCGCLQPPYRCLTTICHFALCHSALSSLSNPLSLYPSALYHSQPLPRSQPCALCPLPSATLPLVTLPSVTLPSVTLPSALCHPALCHSAPCHPALGHPGLVHPMALLQPMATIIQSCSLVYVWLCCRHSESIGEGRCFGQYQRL